MDVTDERIDQVLLAGGHEGRVSRRELAGLLKDLRRNMEALSGARLTDRFGAGQGELGYAATVDDLRALNSQRSPKLMLVKEYWTDGVWGGGLFVLDERSRDLRDDGGTVFLAKDGLRYLRQFSGPVAVEDFGAIGDGSTDDTDAFVRAINSRLAFTLRTARYRITRPLVIEFPILLSGCGGLMSNMTEMRGSSIVIKDFDGAAFILKSDNVQIENIVVLGGRNNKGDGIQIRGSRCSLRAVSTVGHGGSGIRVGDVSASINANGWFCQNIVSLDNLEHGFVVDHSRERGPNVNAGVLLHADLRANERDGLHIGKAYSLNIIGVFAQRNHGRGIFFSGQSRGVMALFPYVENNGAEQLLLDADSRWHVIFGWSQNATNDRFVDRGNQNVVLGRRNNAPYWKSF